MVDLTESIIWKDKEQFKNVFQLLSEVKSCSNAIKMSGTCIGEAEVKMEEISRDINRLIDRLVNGTVRIGIVGLTKAGKSTFLNALLGKSFLPSSIQPQTANEVVIVHDMSKPEGELHCHGATKKAPTRLASGQRDIFKRLKELNDKKRDKDKAEAATVKCNKLVLNAPLQFLTESEIKDVKLELSDTPGFGEAGAKNIAKDVNIAVKEMCAFVLIINSQNMRTVSELKLLNELIHYHPELFNKLNRVLILVNVRSNIYTEGMLSNSATLSPEQVPGYVSEYLKRPEFLNIEIPPDRILIFNALWALGSREWEFKQDLKRTMFYEIMQVLPYFNKTKESNDIEGNMNEENINNTLSLLRPFSQIENVEHFLRMMVVENGRAVLLESAVDDMGSLINQSLIPFITNLMKAKNIPSKKEELMLLQNIDHIFYDLLQTENVFDKFSSLTASSTQWHISTLQDTVQESLKSIASSKITDGLRGVFKAEDKETIINEIHKVNDTIYRAALAKLKSSWLKLSDIIKNVAIDQAGIAFSDFRTSFSSSLSKISGIKNSSFSSLVKDLQSIVPLLLVAASNGTRSLVPDLYPLAVDELSGKETVKDAATFIQIDTKKEIKSSNYKVCTRTGLLWLWRDCGHYTRYYHIYRTVFSPDNTALLSAFDSDIQSWMSLYDDKIKMLLNDISTSTGEAGKAELVNILEEPHQRVIDALQTSQHALEKSQQTVSFLRERKEELQMLKKALGDSLK